MKVRKTAILAMIQAILIPIGIITDKFWLVIVPAIIFFFLIPIAIYGDRWLENTIDWIRAKVNKKYIWLFNLASTQKTNPSHYLYHCVDSIGFSEFTDTNGVQLIVQMYNMSIFTVDIRKVKISPMCNARNTGNMTINIDRKLEWGSWKNLSIPLTITSQKARDIILESYKHKESLSWSFSMHWDIRIERIDRDFPFEATITHYAIPKIPNG